MTPLHVTNGDSALGGIVAAGLEGSFLSWLDVLHEGPVPALPPDQLRAIRAQFIAERGWDEFEGARTRLAERDAALARADDDVVLWFEHDLFDQLQLLEVLNRLARSDGRDRTVTLAQADRYLGEMDGVSLRALFSRRRPVTAETYATARTAWAAFTSADPRSLSAAAARDSTLLPFLAPALARLLEEFPATGTGLSRSERQALDAFASQPRAIGEAFRHVREEPTFLGDRVFAWYLERLSGDRVPLVRLEGGEPIRAPRAWGSAAAAFWARRAELTDEGHAVLEGRADLIRLRGIDRWIGGVHLRADIGIWRRDPHGALRLDAGPKAPPPASG